MVLPLYFDAFLVALLLLLCNLDDFCATESTLCVLAVPVAVLLRGLFLQKRYIAYCRSARPSSLGHSAKSKSTRLNANKPQNECVEDLTGKLLVVLP